MLPFLPAILICGAAYAGVKSYKKRAEKKSGSTPSSILTNETSFSLSHKINRNLGLSLGALALTTGGIIGFPVLILFSIPVEIYLFFPLIIRGYQELIKNKKIGVCVLDAILSVALLGLGYFFASAIFFVLYYSSQKLLLKTQQQSRKNLVNIFGTMPRYVWLLKDDVEIEIIFEDVQKGDVLIIQAGEMIPVDGLIIDGIASVDQHTLTGEAQPAEKTIGDYVFAGTLLLSGKIYIQVEQTSTDTIASQIGTILNNTVDFKFDLQARGEKIADQSALPTLTISAATLFILGPASATTTLLAAFGYNMRFCAPISVLNILKMTSNQGILIKDGRALESLSKVDTIIFDKTGTLTQEQPCIGQIYTTAVYNENQILTFAACAEYKQTHPIAKAILEEARQRQLSLDAADNASYEAGYGIKVTLGDKLVRVGSLRFMQMEDIIVPDDIKNIQDVPQEQVCSLVYVAVDEEFAGAIELHPALRPHVKNIIDQLHQRKIKTYIISGDNAKSTQHLAEQLNIDDYFAEVLPMDKANLIEKLQRQGKKVCFIGDGINDSIALKQADVSVSLGGASSIAIDTAQIVLMDGGLSRLPYLFDSADKLDHNLQQGLALSIIPGVVCIGGVYFLHFGVMAATLLYNIGLACGVANAMSLIRKESNKYKEIH